MVTCQILKNKELLIIDLLCRLEKLYIDCGGFIIKNDQFTGESEGLDLFEALVHKLNQKMKIVHKKIRAFHAKRNDDIGVDSELDEELEKIKWLVKWVEEDSVKVKRQHELDCERKFIAYYQGEYHIGMPKAVLKKRSEMVKVMEEKIYGFNDQIEGDADADDRIRKNLQKLFDKNENEGADEGEGGGAKELEEIDYSVTDDLLPGMGEIDKKISALEKKRDEKMEKVLQNLEKADEIGKNVGDLLDEGNERIEDMITKSDKIIALQEKIDSKLDTAVKEASGSAKFAIFMICTIILMLFLGLGVVVVGMGITTIL